MVSALKRELKSGCKKGRGTGMGGAAQTVKGNGGGVFRVKSTEVKVVLSENGTELVFHGQRLGLSSKITAK